MQRGKADYIPRYCIIHVAAAMIRYIVVYLFVFMAPTFSDSYLYSCLPTYIGCPMHSEGAQVNRLISIPLVYFIFATLF